MPLKVLFAASECAPIVKVGGLGDVIGSLPKALAELGVDARIILPKYGVIEEKKYRLRQVSSGMAVAGEKVDVYQTLLPESEVTVYLLENKKFFSKNDIYFERTAFVGSFKEIERFLFFSMAVSEFSSKNYWRPDILHCHDWHVAMIPSLLKIKCQKLKTLLTIHNLVNQGKWDAGKILEFLDFKGNELDSLEIRDKEGNLNIFEQGILNADTLNTVSPSYKKEILTKECGVGLENSLLKRKKDLYGILNGIDTSVFDPKTDSDIKANYSLADIEKKKDDKLDLQNVLHLERGEATPVLGIISRLTDQKGIDLLVQIVPDLVRLEAQVVVLGVGQLEYERKLAELSLKYPKNVSAQVKFDACLAQKIYAGSDMFLMPSRFEPCGLGQMIAMRYGTIPIVRKTGGLSDAVSNKKNGFVFKNYNAEDFLNAVTSALNVYRNKTAWKLLIKNAMSQDFSWKTAAKKYLKLYQKSIC